jgi:hypothetical protein
MAHLTKINENAAVRMLALHPNQEAQYGLGTVV